MKKIAALLIFFANVLVFAMPAVVEGEDVRIYTLVEFFSTDEAGNKGTSLGMPEMMEGGIKAKVLEVCKMGEYGGEKGNWCRIQCGLGCGWKTLHGFLKNLRCGALFLKRRIFLGSSKRSCLASLHRLGRGRAPQAFRNVGG